MVFFSSDWILIKLFVDDKICTLYVFFGCIGNTGIATVQKVLKKNPSDKTINIFLLYTIATLLVITIYISNNIQINVKLSNFASIIIFSEGFKSML